MFIEQKASQLQLIETSALVGVFCILASDGCRTVLDNKGVLLIKHFRMEREYEKEDF